jgi:WD40 repeat protein
VNRVLTLLLLLPLASGCHSGRQTASVAPATGTPPVAPQPVSEPLRTLQAATDEMISALAFSPDGKQLATGSFNGGVQLWDVASGRLQRTPEGHRNDVPALAFTRDGKALVTGSEDRTVKLWDVATGRLKETLPSQRQVINAIALSPDGRVLATGGGGNSVQLWDTASWQPMRVLQGDEDPGALALSPESMFVSRIAFSPNGKLLAVAHGVYIRGEPSQTADYITVWDTSSWQVKRRLFMGSDFYQVYAVAFAPDNRNLVLGYSRPTAEGNVQVWDIASGEKRVLASFLEWGPVAVQVTLRGKPIVVAGGGDKVTLLALATGKQIGTLPVPGDVMSLAVSPDENVLAVGDTKGTVTLWSLRLGPQTSAPGSSAASGA